MKTLMESAAAAKAAPTDVTTPVTVQNRTVFQSTSLFLIWDIRAAGAQNRKYRRLSPPAVY